MTTTEWSTQKPLVSGNGVQSTSIGGRGWSIFLVSDSNLTVSERCFGQLPKSNYLVLIGYKKFECCLWKCLSRILHGTGYMVHDTDREKCTVHRR